MYRWLTLVNPTFSSSCLLSCEFFSALQCYCHHSGCCCCCCSSDRVVVVVIMVGEEIWHDGQDCYHCSNSCYYCYWCYFMIVRFNFCRIVSIEHAIIVIIIIIEHIWVLLKQLSYFVRLVEFHSVSVMWLVTTVAVVIQ